MESSAKELLALYLVKRTNLLRYFAARMGSIAAAEDLVQDIYLKIAALSDDAVVENNAAFLYRVGANLLLDRVRQERRAVARDAAWSESKRVTVGGEPVADQPSIEDSVDSRRRLEKLTKAVGELPPQMQRAFRLHKLEGLSHADTAEHMGVSVSAVEKHVSAALKALLKRLAP
jgi:RNA polymerase sigma factor (sigma-70 family)